MVLVAVVTQWDEDDTTASMATRSNGRDHETAAQAADERLPAQLVTTSGSTSQATAHPPARLIVSTSRQISLDGFARGSEPSCRCFTSSCLARSRASS